MKIELHEKAEEDINRFSDSIKNKIKSKLKQLEQEKAKHENSKIINVNQKQVFSHKIKNKTLDHRATYDIKQEKIIIYTIFHRDKGYKKEKIARRF